jgi:hypothetical protein
MRTANLLFLSLLVACGPSNTTGHHAGSPDAAVSDEVDASVGEGDIGGAQSDSGSPPAASDGPVAAAPDGPSGAAPDGPSGTGPDVRSGTGPETGGVGGTGGVRAATTLYKPGDSSFILSAGEQRVVVDVSSGNLAEAQSRIDMARMASPAAVIVARLSGTYLVTGSPLRLPSSTCLVLSGTMRAAPGAAAAALVLIDGQTKVSISGGTFDGAGAALNGIRVQGSSKVDIDAVVVRNTGREGISFTGPGATMWLGGSTITRAEVTGCAAGIAVQAATRVLVIDGFVHDNTGAGVSFGAGAGFGAIVHSQVSGNAVGIQMDGTDNAITDNVLDANGTGVQLGATSANDTCLQNTLSGSSAAAIRLDGNNNLVYANTFMGGAAALTSAGTSNSVVPEGAPLAAGGNHYFYPPTAANPHTSPVIVTGKARTDLTISGGSMADVQTQYDQARMAHPNDVIVLHLKGTFTEAMAPFRLSSFTSVILDGTIDVTAATGPAITGGPGLQYVSFSGGTIDAHNQVMEGLSFDLGTLVVLDHVTVKNFGLQSPRSTSNSIRMQGGSGYSIIRGCHVDVSGGRAIWTENASSRYIVVGNTTSHANMDGIDFDAHTANSLAKDNVSDANTRSGLFIEEGAAFNKAYGNTFSNTSSHGINVYSNVAGKSTHQNVAFCNTIIGSRGDGVRIGAINGNTTSDTFLFNNVVSNTGGAGIRLDPLGANNYCAANVMKANNPDFAIDPMAGADFFNAPPPP